MKRLFIVFLAIWAISLMAEPPAFAQEDAAKFKVKVGRVEITPDVQEILDFSTVGKRFIIQFNELPNSSEIQEMSKMGFTLQKYLGGNSWLVKRDEKIALAANALANVQARALLNLSSRMKLSPALEPYSRVSGKKKYHIRFHKDVSPEEAAKIIKSRNLKITKSIYKYSNIYEVTGDFESVIKASSDEDVFFIEPAMPAPKEHNSDAAERTNLDSVQKQKGFRNTSGKSTKVGVWDGGKIYDHNDLKGRVVWVEDSIGTSGHATHVAGTIASSGKNSSRATGMARDAKLYSGNFYGNPLEEMMNAAEKYGITLANNSWGTISGWEYESEDNRSYWRWVGDWMFGYYPALLADADDFIRENNSFLPLFSAGNDRDDSYFGSHYKDDDEDTIYKDLHPPDGDYGSTQTYANAKNILTIGATTMDDVLTSFSCMGPTNDGRIKPDLVAPGYDLYSTYNDGSYVYMSGTSMSCPVVTGVAALITDYYSNRHKKDVSSLTLKNILIHSARDLGNPGPDYAYGHGMVDAELAARVVKKAVFGFDGLPGKFKKKDSDNKMTSIIVEDEIKNKERKIYKFLVPASAKELRATLVWHDPGADKLVNNLDFKIKVAGKKLGKPWVLDPGKPSANAKPGKNSRDNVESILIEDVEEGAKVKITLIGAKIPVGPQAFSMIVSFSDGNDIPEYKKDQVLTHFNAYATVDRDSRDHVTTFHNTDPIYIKSEIQVTKNSSYGNYYASFQGTWEVFDPDGEIIMRTHSTYAPDQNKPGYRYILRTSRFEVMSTMKKGDYKLRVTFTDINGNASTKENTFTIR